MTSEHKPIFQLNNVSKFFSDFQALKSIELELKPGERVLVCGPSGSGKSTMIRCINRLEAHNDNATLSTCYFDFASIHAWRTALSRCRWQSSKPSLFSSVSAKTGS